MRSASSPFASARCLGARTGRTTPDSDIDVLVLERAVHDARGESIRLRSAIGDLGSPIDVIVMSTARYEETKDVIGGLAHPAAKYGQVIYEAA